LIVAFLLLFHLHPYAHRCYWAAQSNKIANNLPLRNDDQKSSTLPLRTPVENDSPIGQDKERLRGFTPPFIIARRRYGTVHCCTAPYGAVHCCTALCRALPLFAVLFSSQAHVHSMSQKCQVGASE